MPKLKNRNPKYRKHKASGRAVVTIAGKDHYLGKYGTKASKDEYKRLVGEWILAGRLSASVDSTAPTISELTLLYWKHAERYYVKNGRQTDEVSGIKAALKHVRALYGRTNAADFGPLALKAVRDRMIQAGNSRRYINQQCSRIRAMFSWAVENEMIPATVAYGLREVKGLREGRSAAKEREPVAPVADAVVDATIPYLPKQTAAMIQVQRLCGCRPEDVCRMRPCDIDRTGDVWLYRPPIHKMMHKGRQRVIFIGPKCQAVLMPYLFAQHGPCFRSRRNCEYNTRSYRDAIHRACDKAGIERWNPNQLRHSTGTEIRKQFGLEAAQVVLGHSKADVTQVYAERDLSLAVEVARSVG